MVFLSLCIASFAVLVPYLPVWVVFRCLYDCISCAVCCGGCFSCPTHIIIYMWLSSVSLPYDDVLCWPLSCQFRSVCFPYFFLRQCSRFGLAWFRLPCDHGWIRSGPVHSCDIKQKDSADPVDPFSATKRDRRWGRRQQQLLNMLAIKLLYESKWLHDVDRCENSSMLTVQACQQHRLVVICMYGHTYSKSMDQPGKVVSPARGQLNKKNE